MMFPTVVSPKDRHNAAIIRRQTLKRLGVTLQRQPSVDSTVVESMPEMVMMPNMAQSPARRRLQTPGPPGERKKKHCGEACSLVPTTTRNLHLQGVEAFRLPVRGFSLSDEMNSTTVTTRKQVEMASKNDELRATVRRAPINCAAARKSTGSADAAPTVTTIPAFTVIRRSQSQTEMQVDEENTRTPPSQHISGLPKPEVTSLVSRFGMTTRSKVCKPIKGV
jgi:hypothetical protein